MDDQLLEAFVSSTDNYSNRPNPPAFFSFPYLSQQINVIKYTIFLQWATQTKYTQLINAAVISLIFQ